MADLLTSGIYSIPDIADLVDVPVARVRAWVGTPRGRQVPVIDNDLGRIGTKNAVSFANLMELRFVAFFTKAGVPLREVRRIMDEARRAMEHPHPFATKTVFKTDGKKIVAEIAEKAGVPRIYDLRSNNYEMHDVVFESLKADVTFDPQGNTSGWWPRRELAPHVAIFPFRSFGRPVLEEGWIPTETLAQAVKVEGDVEIVADLFEVSERGVREAVTFESSLRRAA